MYVCPQYGSVDEQGSRCRRDGVPLQASDGSGAYFRFGRAGEDCMVMAYGNQGIPEISPSDCPFDAGAGTPRCSFREALRRAGVADGERVNKVYTRAGPRKRAWRLTGAKNTVIEDDC